MHGSHKITLMAILVLLVSQAFMSALVSGSFEKVVVASKLARHSVAQKEFKRQVEGALRFGKPLDSLLGMDTLLAQAAAHSVDLANIVVYSASGDVLSSLRPVDRFPTFLNPPPQEHPKAISLADPLLQAWETSSTYSLALPLFAPAPQGGSSPVIAGTVVFAFFKENIRSDARLFWHRILQHGAFIFAAAALLLILALSRLREPDVSILRRKVFLHVLMITILAQIGFAMLATRQFHQDHIRVLQERVHAQLDLVRQEVERVLAKGVSLERVRRMDEYLTELLKTNPELSTLLFLDAQGSPVAQAMRPAQAAWFAPTAPMEISLPLRASTTNIQGSIHSTLDAGALSAVLWKILLDACTVVLIASLFIVEQVFFLVSRIHVCQERDDSCDEAQTNLDLLLLARFAAFTFMFAFALSASFVPLQMRELYTPLWGLPKDLVLGLPIAAEMLCVLLTSLIAGATADRWGWQPPFLVGLATTAIGLFCCFQAGNGLEYILARGICGLGYGLSWMSLQTFLFTHSTPSTRAQGSSHFVAGIFSGHICGTALGGMLAERMGFRLVFLTGSLLTISCIALFFLFLRRVPGRAEKGPGILVEPRAVLRYLTHRNTFALISCCIVPFSICQVGLLFFATPLYLNQLGISQADIGRVLMIYGLSVVYLAPQISKMVDRRERKLPFIVAGGLVGGLGLTVLFTLQGLMAVMAAIFLLGLGSSIGSSAQTAFALKSRATQELGPGKAMAIQRAMDKLGQMLGPVLLGLLMSGGSIAQGLMVLGVGYMMLSGLFLVLAREREA